MCKPVLFLYFSLIATSISSFASEETARKIENSIFEAGKAKGIKSVACPLSVETILGTVVNCTATNQNGDKIVVKATAIDDSGNFEFHSVLMIEPSTVEKAILDAVKKNGFESVSCPKSIDQTINTLFYCTSNDNKGRNIDFEVKIIDEKGNFEFRNILPLDTESVEKEILELGKSKNIVSVECPESIDDKIGTAFGCKAKTKEGKPYDFNVRVIGKGGQVEIQGGPSKSEK